MVSLGGVSLQHGALGDWGSGSSGEERSSDVTQSQAGPLASCLFW